MIIHSLGQSVEVKHPTHLYGRPRIACNRWGNWAGYVGSRRVWDIGASEFEANLWLEEQRRIQFRPGTYWQVKVPEGTMTGRVTKLLEKTVRLERVKMNGDEWSENRVWVIIADPQDLHRQLVMDPKYAELRRPGGKI